MDLAAEFAMLGLGSEGWQREMSPVQLRWQSTDMPAPEPAPSPAPAFPGHLEQITLTTSPVPQFPRL